MDLGSESDTVSVRESKRSMDGLYSEKIISVSDYFSNTDKFIKSDLY